MDIRIERVTEKNLNHVLKLEVSPEQSGYIESVSECIEDSKRYKEFEPVCLYADSNLVGFAMYGLFLNEGNSGRVWLDRFLIDKGYQGKGLGNIMLDRLISHITEIYRCNQIFLSLYDDNKLALHIYKKFGFVFNGEYDINGEKVMVKNLS